MTKKRMCADCANFAPHGHQEPGKEVLAATGDCRFGGGACGCKTFAVNAACKAFLARERVCSARGAQPQPGDAPFCGDFAKCNNAEGCDTCAEFERWAEAKDEQN